jgi:hypothetical protein
MQKPILERFEPITLPQMEAVKLMNRADTKYVFGREQYNSILLEALADYRILEIEGKRLSRYKTLYYDTKEYRLYTQHHNGELNRYKVRYRYYVESGVGFLEVKFKNNKGRTIKNRIQKNEAPRIWEKDMKAFLQEKTLLDAEKIIPSIWVNYSRVTLVHKNNAERVTIDTDLEFINTGSTMKLDNLVIAEIKQEKRKASAFLKIMRKYHIKEGSISKYCLGISLTCSNVKRNNFKEKLLTLKHILHDDPVASR